MITPYMQTAKTILIITVISLAIWFYKDYQFQKIENIRQKENSRQEKQFDSLRISSLILDEKQMNDYIRYNKELAAIIKEYGVKLRRVTSIMNQNFKFHDTTVAKTDLSPILEAINKKENFKQNFIDSTLCMIIGGTVSYRDGAISLELNNRIFKNETTAIAYWQRKEWSFLGLKTRFLGKKEATAKIVDKCGESQIIKVEVKK